MYTWVTPPHASTPNFFLCPSSLHKNRSHYFWDRQRIYIYIYIYINIYVCILIELSNK
jgi:hypothetical protein